MLTTSQALTSATVASLCLRAATASTPVNELQPGRLFILKRTLADGTSVEWPHVLGGTAAEPLAVPVRPEDGEARICALRPEPVRRGDTVRALTLDGLARGVERPGELDRVTL